ncbi:c-type cytochrome [Riemerella anatipestifer]|uniref:c-type cytochrome n=1 Tax=Riemerella anatipestifer TaxID=34085 RepID=UPI0021A99990|nr:c-type cytochrome [Riemerella anatipestifer]
MFPSLKPYLFKVPSLRNVEKTYPYFHDGSVASLEEAVRIMSKIQNNKDISDKDVENIVAFLKSLTADIDNKYKTVANK